MNKKTKADLSSLPGKASQQLWHVNLALENNFKPTEEETAIYCLKLKETIVVVFCTLNVLNPW